MTWPILTINDIKAPDERSIAIGPFGSRMKSDQYVDHGVPVIRGTNLTGGRELSGDFVYVSEETANELRACNVFADDLVFPHRGAIGEVGIVPDDDIPRYILSTSLMKLTCNRDVVDPRFVYYFFKSDQGRQSLLQHASVVGTPGIGQPLTSLRSVRIPVPPLHEQETIAHILSTLDDKIELNRRMSQTLEEIARTLFKSWFVDFDPVHAKAAGRAPVGMDAETAALFPSEFEVSELGLIPKGWKVSTIGKEFNVTMGQSPPGSTYNEIGEGLPFYQGRSDFGFRFPRVRVFCKEPNRIANPGDTLLSVRAPVGSINMANQQCAIGRGVAALHHRQGVPGITYLTLQSMSSQLSAFDSEGTVFGAINKSSLEGLKIVAPPANLIRKLESQASSLDNRIAVAADETNGLVELRDSLLPELLSGSLCLPNPLAEDHVE